nr:MAG TPA: hypothetical protein [Caudoviricetes sp.]
MKEFTVSEAKMLLKNGKELDQVFNFSNAYLEDFVQCLLGTCGSSEGMDRLRVIGRYDGIGFVLEIFFPLEKDNDVQIVFDSDVCVYVDDCTERNFCTNKWYYIGYTSIREKYRNTAGFGSDLYKDKKFLAASTKLDNISKEVYQPTKYYSIMKANNFKFESATLAYEGYKKCGQFFDFIDEANVSELLANIQAQCSRNKYKNKLDVCLSYGDVGMVITIDYDNNNEVFVLTDKDVRLPLTEKYDMLVDEGTRTYICSMNKDGEIEWNEWAEEMKAETAEEKEDIRSYNVGSSDYAKHDIQPWDIWLSYDLNPWDADIVKRVLRTKKTDGRKLDYEKIIHICKERIRQIETYGK